MRKTLFVVSALVVAASCAAYSDPISCFVVHADPTHVDDAAFETLVDFVALADDHHVPLTLLFTAQWAELISADPAKVSIVEDFVARGHEIGAHHHAYWATQDRGAQWDGYTNTPQAELQIADRGLFRGTMDDYWRLVFALPGTHETACMGLVDEDSADWICELRYSTFGHTLADAASQPETVTFGSCSALELHHALLVEPEPGDLERSYAATSDDVLFAVVAHVSDYADRPAAVARWFRFLAGRDAAGERRATVAEAILAWTNP